MPPCGALVHPVCGDGWITTAAQVDLRFRPQVRLRFEVAPQLRDKRQRGEVHLQLVQNADGVLVRGTYVVDRHVVALLAKLQHDKRHERFT